VEHVLPLASSEHAKAAISLREFAFQRRMAVRGDKQQLPITVASPEIQRILHTPAGVHN
jgi:hypothetical protein